MSDLSDIIRKETKILTQDGLPSDVSQWISTGATLLDYAISNQDNGGIPVGKISTINGLEGSGKTLFAMQIARNAQKDGALVIYMDTENALNSDFAQRIGLDTSSKNFIYMKPLTIEDVFKSMFTIFHKIDEVEKSKSMNHPYVLIVWDSLAATPSKVDLEDENPDPTANVGLIPRILSKNLRSIVEVSGRKKVAILIVNQLRTNIKAGPFSDPWVTTGGRALAYVMSVDVRLFSGGKIKAQDDIVGIKTSAKVNKTRFGPPHRKAEFGLYFDRGVDDTESVIDFLLKEKGIQSKNAGPKGKQIWLEEKPDELWTRIQLKKKIITDPEFKKKIYNLVSEYAKRDLVDSTDKEETIEKD